MWSVQLIVLLLGATTVIAGQNQTNQVRNEQQQQFSVEEVLLLNRQFLDYLAVFDESQLEDPAHLRCASLMRQLAQAYLNRERHGLEWFDSWGKIPDGMYFRNGHAFGNYEQCRRFSWGQVRGQHCTFLAALPNADFELMFSGLCVPASCEPEFAMQLYGQYLASRSVAVVTAFDAKMLCTKDEGVTFNGAVVTAIVIFSIIAGLVLASTSYEIVQLVLKREVHPLYSAFSLYRNIRSILHIVPKRKDTETKTDMIECAHGIRALSMIWIIIVHVHESINLVPVNNAPTRASYLGSFSSAVMWMTGYLAVDTFLALSGMLVAWNMLRELDKKGKINPLMLYLHRYIRITAPFAALILFTVSFVNYMGEGPLWRPLTGTMVDTCDKYWWSALLHVQNYVNPRNQCLAWTWYLSVDMQLYIVAPALIYPLWRFGKRVLIAIAGLAVLSIACVFTTIIINDFRMNLTAPTGEGLRSVLTYYPTHARMAVWLFGTIFGYILYKTKDTGVNLPKRYWATGWAICFAILGVTLYANYEFQRADYRQFSNVLDAFYESLFRSLFGICVMWIILACVNGKAGVINEFLSASLWQPLSKLSFTMYLLHVLLLIMASIASARTDLHFSVMDLFYRIWGAIGLTTSVALLWSAIFEVPFVTLDKLLLRS